MVLTPLHPIESCSCLLSSQVLESGSAPGKAVTLTETLLVGCLPFLSSAYFSSYCPFLTLKPSFLWQDRCRAEQ